MKKKEIAEIKRRLRIDRTAITQLRGCYVNSEKKVLATFDRTFGNIPEEERFKYLAIFNKTLSGTVGSNLLDIEFETGAVVSGEEHKLLMTLRDSKLADTEAVETFYSKIIEGASFEGNYLILLVHESYDIPKKGKDNITLRDGSDEVYNYIMCSICPVNLTKPGLSYYAEQNAFHDRTQDWQVDMPELGFLFPAFDDRSPNIYGSLYYLKNPGQKHEDFAMTVFAEELPPTAIDQKEMFNEVLTQTLGESCNYDVVKTLQSEIRTRSEQGESDEPPTLSAREIGGILGECGVDSNSISRFEERYDDLVGDFVPAKNLSTTKTVIKTENVVISANIDGESGMEVREIGGRKYLMIPIEDCLEINGVVVNSI